MLLIYIHYSAINKTQTTVKNIPFTMNSVCKINGVILRKSSMIQWRKKTTKPCMGKNDVSLNMGKNFETGLLNLRIMSSHLHGYPNHLNTMKVPQLVEQYDDLMFKQPPEVFYEKGVLGNLAKWTEKHLCQSLFFNKVAGLGLQIY